MAKESKNDVLQIITLTLFFVSAFLAILNLVFASQREDAFKRAQDAVADYNWLKDNLKKPHVREAIALAREQKESEGRADLHTYINNRLTELPGVDASTKLKAKKDRSGRYLVHLYKLQSSTRSRTKVEKEFQEWVSFLGRVEADRPDIHVDQVVLETKESQIPESGKRKWSCDADLVLWQPVAQAE